jgi:thymidine phosphorylase
MVAGSILSKKVAENPAALVIDVKLGKGALIRDENYMIKLAHSLVRFDCMHYHIATIY